MDLVHYNECKYLDKQYLAKTKYPPSVKVSIHLIIDIIDFIENNLNDKILLDKNSFETFNKIKVGNSDSISLNQILDYFGHDDKRVDRGLGKDFKAI